MKTQTTFGDNVRAAREALGWSQEDLAHEAGFRLGAINRIECGHQQPRLPTLLRLASALGKTPNDLVAGIELPKAPKRGTEAPIIREIPRSVKLDRPAA